MNETENQKKQTLKTYFGYDAFRPGQEEIIDQILSGRDVLAVMPTGAGKSLCYQVPALLMPGITVVVSPLISLMMDQVKALNEAGIHAAYINSSLTEGQIGKALELAKSGQYKIIYVAPERLETPRFLDFACHTELSMITVDEAHCISQWGQDFRPSYVRILSFVRQLPMRPVISAFTATATERVRKDILDSLKLEDPYEAVTGFDRENLYFEVQNVKDREKPSRISEYLEKHRQGRARRRTGGMYSLLFTPRYGDQPDSAGKQRDRRRIHGRGTADHAHAGYGAPAQNGTLLYDCKMSAKLHSELFW